MINILLSLGLITIITFIGIVLSVLQLYPRRKRNNMETKHKIFKPFDKVLVRDYEWAWSCNFYSYYSEDTSKHYLISGSEAIDDDILPYEGNEHLVGTKNKPDEEVKLEEGEWLMCAAAPYDAAGDWVLRQFSITRETSFLVVNGGYWAYAIPFVDFNPNDMEETKKHILCVKNGKVVKYKG